MRSTRKTNRERKNDPVLITGGAGFIGTNVAHRFPSRGEKVLLFDNLSRPGVKRNLEWLQQTYGELVQIQVGEVQNIDALRKAVRQVSRVFHFAAQVAVTTSLVSPLMDFEVNARGTLNLLEALRELPQPPPLVFTSTNKVYGDLRDVKLQANARRYEPEEEVFRTYGFSEHRPLEFHSPYGCSKGAACQYVLDYARTFGLPAVVFRMSCIYGPHQFGNEDQGWVAHFLIRALQGEPLTIYGDGKQVRDILFVEDLVDAFELALGQIHQVSGNAFNIGGGPGHTVSLLELLDLIGEMNGCLPKVKFEPWRPADQKFYVSDTRKFASATGWTPRVSVREGIAQLHRWLMESRGVTANGTPSPRELDVAIKNGAAPKVPNSSPAIAYKEPRSKRLWRTEAMQKRVAERQILKFR